MENQGNGHGVGLPGKLLALTWRLCQLHLVSKLSPEGIPLPAGSQAWLGFATCRWRGWHGMQPEGFVFCFCVIADFFLQNCTVGIKVETVLCFC